MTESELLELFKLQNKRLKEENARLRIALEKIAEGEYMVPDYIARQALENNKE